MLKMLHRKTVGDLRANWKSFLAVWLVLTLGGAFYGAMYPSGIGLADSVYRTYDSLDYLDYHVRLEGASLKAADPLERLPGVKAVEARLVVEAGMQLDPGRDTITALRLISLPDHGEPQVNRLDLTAGRLPNSDEEIVLLKRFAERHNLQPGQSLQVWIGGQKRSLTISGLAFSPEYLVAGRSREIPFPTTSSFGVGWMRYNKLSGLARQGGRINDIVLRLYHPRLPSGISDESPAAVGEALRPAIEAALARYDEVEVFSRIQTASGGVIDANINGNLPVLITFSGLFLVGALLVTSILLGRMVQSERQRIGTMRALGVQRSELVAHYLTFGVIVGLSGGVAGAVLGYLNSFVMMAPFVDTIAGGYLPGYINRPQWLFILLGAGAVALGATLSGAYSAWRESATSPGIALRPPMPNTPNAISRLPLGGLPLPVRQTVRNMLRVPGRSLGTLVGVIAGATMVFSSLAILNTLDSSFESYYASGQYDLRVVFPWLMPGRSLEDEMRDIEHVQAVQGAMFGPISVRRPQGGDFDTYAFVIDESQPFYHLQSLAGAPAFAPVEGVWIGNNLQRVLGLQVGDPLTLESLGEVRQTVVAGVVSQVMGSPVFIPRSLMTTWMPGRSFAANAALLRVEPGYLPAVQEQASALNGVIDVQNYAAFTADLRAYVQYWRQTSLLFAMFGALLTLAVILNTVSASLNEQANELAILRSLGISGGEIAFSVLLELLLIGGAGIAIGAPLGRELGFVLTSFYNTDFYGMWPHLSRTAYLIGGGGLLLTVLMAALPGLRRVQQVDLGRVSKAQSL